MKDTYEDISCPACGKKMKKVFLNKQEFFVDICLDGCGGIWFDNRELPKADEKEEHINELSDAYKDKTFAKVNKEEERFCPLCKQKMVKNSVSAKQEVSIDECYTCGGKFFDYNELEQMRNQYEDDEDRIRDIKKLSEDSEFMELMFQQVLDKDKFTI